MQGKEGICGNDLQEQNSGSNAIGFLVEQLKNKGFVVSKTVVLDKKKQMMMH